MFELDYRRTPKSEILIDCNEMITNGIGDTERRKKKEEEKKKKEKSPIKPNPDPSESPIPKGKEEEERENEVPPWHPTRGRAICVSIGQR